MEKIVIKEIDKLYSKIYKDKTVIEYLVYYIENDVKINTSIQLGEEAKNKKIKELLASYNSELIIEIIKFEDNK